MPKKDKKSKKALSDVAASAELSMEDESQALPTESGIEPLVDLSRIDPAKLQMARELGIDIEAIIKWANSVEARFKALEEHLPDYVQKGLQQALEKAQREHTAQRPATPAQGGQRIGIGDLLRIIGGGSGSGGYDEEMNRLVKDTMRMNLERMRADLGFTDAVKEAIVKKIAGGAASEIMK